MNRAYAILEIKAVDEKRRTFKGIATTPSTDRMGDIVEPKGAVFKLPIPLLWQHDARQPIGWVTLAKVTDKGIAVEGDIADVPEDGSLKQRLTEAWQMVTAKLVRGLSIGFRPLDNGMEPINPKEPWGPMRFTAWEWLELSAVTIPANQDATITAIKALDDRIRQAVSGQPPGRSGSPPGVPGTATKAASGRFSSSRKDNPMKSMHEQLEELRAARADKAKRMTALKELAEGEDRDLSEEEQTEIDTLLTEVRGLDSKIRLKEIDVVAAGKAVPVDGSSPDAASRSRGPSIHVRNADPDDKFKGQSYVRMVIAKALASREYIPSSVIAQARWGKSNPTLVRLIKANEVAAGGEATGSWGAELVSADNRFRGDFIEYLHGMTVFDRLPLRPVPANVAIKGQDGASTGYWIGEGKAIKVTDASSSTVDLKPLKVAALAVVTNELLRDSSPDAEMLVRDCLAEASTQRIDQTFLSTDAASEGVSPAGILNSVTIGSSGGATADDLRDDIAGLVNKFIAAKNVTGLTFVTTPALALAIQLLRNALGQREFPGVTMKGGELEGMTLVTGDNVGPGDLILLKPSDIWRIGDSGLEVSISREATIEMASDPTGAALGSPPVGASKQPVNMFQSESTAIKVVRSINFKKRRADAVAYIGNAAYGTPTSI